MYEEKLENKNIYQLNLLLEEKGFGHEKIYELNDSNLQEQFINYLNVFEAGINGENSKEAMYFSKNSLGQFKGFATETEAKEYIINILKDLN